MGLRRERIGFLAAAVAAGVFGPGAAAAGPAAKVVLDALPAERGLVVHAGAADAGLALALAQARPLVVHVLLGDAGKEQTARATLVEAGLHGQVTVAGWRGGTRLPLLDNTAVAVIADLDASPGLTMEECLRAARAGGIAYVRRDGAWSARSKPRAADVDDWPEYAHDAAASDVSNDRRAGPAIGLQWQAGPDEVTKDGVRLLDGVWVACEDQRLPDLYGGERRRLIARDALTGLPLWQRPDVTVNSRFAFLLGRGRVYVNPRGGPRGWPAPRMLALDLHTGRTVLELTEGITFQPPAELPKDRKEQEKIRDLHAARAGGLHARLSEGVLLQVTGREMVALEADSGQRLWRKDIAQDTPYEGDRWGNLSGTIWMHPAVRDGVVYALQGTGARSFSYTHWPVASCDRVVAMDLKTGRERWAWPWPAEHGKPPIAYNMTCDEGVLALAVRTVDDDKRERGKLRLLLIDARGPRLISYQPTGKGRENIGGGHSHARAMINAGKVWVCTIYGGVSIDLADPAHRIDKTYDGLRPVGCTVWRSTPKWLLGSLTAAALDGSGFHWTDAHRTHCDVGAFPANGLLYLTPNFCGCQPYQPGSNTTHSRLIGEDASLVRRERGPGEPAPAADGAEAGWPALLGDNLRSAWKDTKLPRQLKVAWQTKLASAPPADELLRRDWDNHYYTHGPVTAASVAEGVCVLAMPHRQEVGALDAATGRLRWRIAVDGRVESPPTIGRGLVLFGTRNGWVYAVRRDTGQVVWRFFAAPSAERIAVNGQLESPWPVFGSVVLDGDDVWAFAGRHSDLDGGIRWWRLAAATGEVRAKGRLGYDELRHDAKQERPIRMANMPPVYDGKRFYFAQQFLAREGRGLVAWDNGLGRTGHEWDNWQARSRIDAMIPANTGTIQDGRRERGLNANSHYYAGTRAKQFCYRSDDFIGLLGSTEKGNRGGSPAANLLRMRRLRPDEKQPERGVASVPVWKDDRPNNYLGRNSYKACAVAGDRVLAAYSIEGQDSWRLEEPRHRLKVLDYATGQTVQELHLPAPALYAGVAVAGAAVFVVTEDGSVTCLR